MERRSWAVPIAAAAVAITLGGWRSSPPGDSEDPEARSLPVPRVSETVPSAGPATTFLPLQEVRSSRFPLPAPARLEEIPILEGIGARLSRDFRALSPPRRTELPNLAWPPTWIGWNGIFSPNVPSLLTSPGKDLRRLRALLADLPQGAEAVSVVQRWLNDHLVRGSTTLRDVEALWGRSYLDLDRPPDEDVLTVQYPLDMTGGWGMVVVFEFGRTNRALLDAYPSFWICGYCPHVLVNDGRWRLEGKMLAGRVGIDREGADMLPLPRLHLRDGRLDVRLANWAPETEYLDHVELGVVVLQAGEQLAVADDGRLCSWRAVRRVHDAERDGDTPAEWDLSDRPPGQGVLVFELRNSSEFENQMRRFLAGTGARPDATIRVSFDSGPERSVQPVGTKFYRRVAVQIPDGARRARVHLPIPLWFVHRAWLAAGRNAAGAVSWFSPVRARGPATDAAERLRHRDGMRLRLNPTEEVDLTFRLPAGRTESERMGYLLRLSGYYVFQGGGALEGATGH